MMKPPKQDKSRQVRPRHKGILARRTLNVAGALFFLFVAMMSIGSRPSESLPIPTPTGMIMKPSPYSVAETQQRFISILESEGLNVFATVDHAQNAEGAGLSLRPTRVVIFGNPKLGTPLMQCGQSIAIDLPQKMLIWENDKGQVQIGYNDPRYLGGRHQLNSCGNEVIQQIAGALDTFSSAAIMP